MQYRFASVLAAGALVAMVNGAPIPTEQDGPQLVGKPSSVVTWGKRDIIWDTPAPVDTIGLGKPSSDVSWGKRDVPEPNTIELGDATTVVTWGKRDDEPETTDPTIGKPDSTIIWGRDAEEGNKFTIGDATTVVSWDKREAEAGDANKDEFTLGKPTTVIEWDRRDVPDKNVIENGKPTTDVTWS